MEKNDLAAFKAFYEAWIVHNPHADEYLPFDFHEFFTAGGEAHRESVWHLPEEVPEHGKTIVGIDVETGTCELSYGGGYITSGCWAYAQDLLNEDMMRGVREREAEIKAWVDEEQRQLERKRLRALEVAEAL